MLATSAARVSAVVLVGITLVANAPCSSWGMPMRRVMSIAPAVLKAKAGITNAVDALLVVCDEEKRHDDNAAALVGKEKAVPGTKPRFVPAEALILSVVVATEMFVSVPPTRLTNSEVAHVCALTAATVEFASK